MASSFTLKREVGWVTHTQTAEVVPTLAQGLHASLPSSPTMLPLLGGALAEGKRCLCF